MTSTDGARCAIHGQLFILRCSTSGCLIYVLIYYKDIFILCTRILYIHIYTMCCMYPAYVADLCFDSNVFAVGRLLSLHD